MLEHYRLDPTARTISFYATQENVAVSERMISQLLGVSIEHENANVRACLHCDAGDVFHQMLILEWMGNSFPAHRHPAKSEGYHLMHGRMDVILYNEDGSERERFEMNVENPIARVGPQTFHALEIRSPYAIYLESKPGPFLRDTDKIMAPWLTASPSPDAESAPSAR